MFTVKLHEYGPEGLKAAVLKTAESVEITLMDDGDYFVDLYEANERTGRLCLRSDRVAHVFVENAHGKTVQRLDSKAMPK